MTVLRVLALAAIVFSSPALADGWRVVSVTGDAVSVLRDDIEPLAVNDIVPENASVVTNLSQITLTRNGDKVSLDANSVVGLNVGLDGHRASLEAKAGKVVVVGAAPDAALLEVKTKQFSVEAGTASFTIIPKKDFSEIIVELGQVSIKTDPKKSDSFRLSKGDSFRQPPLVEAAKPLADTKGASSNSAADDALAEAALKKMDEDNKKTKKKKVSSALAAKIAARAGAEMKEGLDSFGADSDDETPEPPKTGILNFLFGPGAPDTALVGAGLAAVFVGLGYFASAVLGEASFGLFGNAAILLIGAIVGAGLHDLAFSPESWWDYEPYPGILLPVLGGFAALIGACFARRYLEDQAERSAALKPKTTASAKPRVTGLRSPRTFG